MKRQRHGSRPNQRGIYPRKHTPDGGAVCYTPGEAMSAAVSRLMCWIRTRERLMACDEPWCSREIADLTARLHPLLLSIARVRASGEKVIIPDAGIDRIVSAVASRLSPLPLENDEPILTRLRDLTDVTESQDPAYECVKQLEEEGVDQ